MIQFQNNEMTVFQSSLYMTTSAVVQTEEAVILTDPNWLPNEIEEIRQYIDRIIGNRQLYIIFTHSDFDHIIGSGAFPEAKVIAAENLENHPDKEAVMEKVHRFDQQYYIHRDYKPEYPSVDIVVSKDGQKLELGSLTLTFYKAPGHTDDGLFTVIDPLGIFLSGDYLSDVEFPFIFSSYKDYVNTIQKVDSILREHHVTTHVPGHGTVVQNLDEIRGRIDSSKFYLEQLVLDDDRLEEYLKIEYGFFEGMKSNHANNRKMSRQE